MMAKVTQFDAEQAIREGVETARLKRENARLSEMLERVSIESEGHAAKLRTAESAVHREHAQVARRYAAMHEQIEDARSERWDWLIIGFGFGMLAAFAVCSWIVYAM